MSSYWKTERWRLAALLLAIVLLGLASGYWLIALILPTAIYLGWQIQQLYRVEQWLAKGARKRKAPDVGGAWEAIVTYILQREKRHKSRKKRLSKLAKSYRDTVVALPDAVVILNDKLEIEWANDPADQLLGITLKRDIGYRITNLIRDPAFNQYINARDTRSMEVSSPLNDEQMLLMSIIRYGQDQQLLIARDISERVRSRQALQAFVANASHELRTPLTVTSGYIDLLQEDPDLPEQLLAPIAQLREQTDRMSELIGDLLTLSKLEGGALAAHEGNNINIPALLSQITNDLAATNAKDTHPIQLDVDSLLGLRGVKRELVSVISNLINNAIKYTPAGTPIVVVWQTNKAGCPCLTVKDQGPGFDAKYIPTLTNRFFRINNSSTTQQEGSGLGLAIVKHAVVRHGGHLTINSKPGEGAQFKVCFPESRAASL